MKTRFLFPSKYKKLGWLLFGSGLILGIILLVNEFEVPNIKTSVFPLLGEDGGLFTVNESLKWSTNNIADELASVLLIIGGLLVGFSATKQEDEYINKIRTESLLWSVYVNYAFLLFAVIFVFDSPFLKVIIYNMFTILIIFIVRFHYMLYKTSKLMAHEE